MKILVVSLLCLSLLAACKKEKTQIYQSQGVLLGPDMGLCMICGGQEVQINGDASQNQPVVYHTNSNFQALGLNQTLTYPANVSLDWSPDTSIHNAFKWIIITAIKVNN